MSPWKLKLVRQPPEVERPIQNTGALEPIGSSPPPETAWGEDKQLSLLVLLGLAFGAGYLTYVIFRPFLTALFVALIMAIASAPLHKWMSRRVRSPRLAAMATTVVAIFAVLIPFTIVSAKLTLEATANYRTVLSQLSNTATWPERLDPLLDQVAEQAGLPPAQLKAEVVGRARDLGSRLIAAAGSVAQHFAQQMMTLLLGAAFLYPLIRSGDELRSGALGLLPISPARTRELAVAVNQGVIANVYGMLSVGIAEGILISIGFWITGIGSPLIWGAIATILSFLPYLGVSLVWITGCIFLALHEQWLNTIALCLWGLLVVSTADGFVRSRVISGRVKTNSLLITLSLMGGLAVFGPIGFFVGPVAVVVLASLLRILREEHAAVRRATEKAA